MELSTTNSHQANRFFEIGPLTFIELRGGDCHKVLNNLATADISPSCFEPVEGGARRIRESFFTDVKGRTVGHGLVLGHAEGLWMVGAAGQAERLITHWGKYVIREDCHFIDRSAEFHPFLIRDHAARRLANELRLPLTEELKSVEVTLGGIPVLVIQVRWSHQDELILLVKHNRAAILRDHLCGPIWTQTNKLASPTTETNALASGDLGQWELFRIRFGWPVFGKDITVTNLPQEIDRDRLAISFKKGCYLGQETIARLDALGQVQKKLMKWRIDRGEPHVGEKLILDGKEAGQITSVAFDPEAGNFVALVMTKRSHFDKGTALS
jgi:hypothetical protein